MISTLKCTLKCAFFLLLMKSTLGSPEEWNKVGESTLRHALWTFNNPNTNTAKNIILFLGDGMGISTVTAARIRKGQLNGKLGEEETLTFDRFPHVALSRTYSNDFQVPDSAATATAYLCGVKANHLTLGLNDKARVLDCGSERGNEVSSIVDWARAEGKSTGIVTTTRITHATPAAAYAHSAYRSWEADDELPAEAKGKCKDIAVQFYENARDMDVVLSSGRKYLTPTDVPDPENPLEKGRREDGRNLIEEWKTHQLNKGMNFSYVWNKTAFDRIHPAKTDRLLGLFGADHMQYEADRAEDVGGEPSIAEMVEKAIKMVEHNENGYFLLVEGGRIDHGHHQGKPYKAITDAVAFDLAVEKAVNLTSERDTLLVVTADHSHVFAIGGYPTRGNPIFGKVNTNSPEEGGTGALDKMLYTTLMYTNGPGYTSPRGNIASVDTEQKDYVSQTAVPTFYETHGGEDVGIYARGPMAHLFHGVHEQNYIAHAMAFASCVGKYKDTCPNRHTSHRPPSTGSSLQLSSTLIIVSSLSILRFLTL